jgi:hypothetical protein
MSKQRGAKKFDMKLRDDVRAEFDKARGSVPLATWLKGLGTEEVARLNARVQRDALAEAAGSLARLSIQGERYANDDEYRDAVDEVFRNLDAEHPAEEVPAS